MIRPSGTAQRQPVRRRLDYRAGHHGKRRGGQLYRHRRHGIVALDNGTQPVVDSLGNYFGGGVAIRAGASGNRIGTDGNSLDDVGERNVVAGSDNDAIDIYGTGTEDNVVAGNFIGTDVTGTYWLGVAGDGVFLAEGGSSTGLGSTRRVVRRFMTRAISFPGMAKACKYSTAQFQRRRREQDGTDVSGTVALGNWYIGVEIYTGCIGNTIGGTTSGAAT